MGTMAEHTGRQRLIDDILDWHAREDPHEQHMLSQQLAALSYDELKRRHNKESRWH